MVISLSQVTEIAKNRISGLSDGVFSIAMTLLVLDLTLPTINRPLLESEISATIFGIWPKILMYFLSFLILAVVWVNHQYMFRYIGQVNSRMVWMNIIMLMFAALMPFTTSLVGDYWASQIVVLIFGANGLITLTLFMSMWWYCRRKGLLQIKIPKSHMKLRQIVDMTSFILVILAVGLSFVNTIITLVIYGVVILFHVVGTAIGLHEYKAATELSP